MKQLAFLILVSCACAVTNLTNAQEVKINSNFTIESDGTLSVSGTATTWEDLRVPLSSANKKAAAQYTFIIGSSGPKVDWFADDNLNEMYFVAQMPHSWKEGTTIYPHIHWIPEKNGTQNVRWGLEYAWVNRDDAITSYTIDYGHVDTEGTTNYIANTHYITKLGVGIDGTGKKISSMLVCRIFRDAASDLDKYPDKAGALEVDFHYEVNTMGSRLEYTK